MKPNLVNINVLRSWQDVDPNRWQQIALDVLNIYFENSDVHYKKILSAVNKKDFEQIKTSAHTLKSSCGNVGAEHAFQLLDEVEMAINMQNFDSIWKILTEFKDVFQKTQYALLDYQAHYQIALAKEDLFRSSR